MTSIVRVTALSGGVDKNDAASAASASAFASEVSPSDRPHCYLLELDEFTFLLDCGWDEAFTKNHLERLKYESEDAHSIPFP